MLRDMITWDHL